MPVSKLVAMVTADHAWTPDKCYKAWTVGMSHRAWAAGKSQNHGQKKVPQGRDSRQVHKA
jgi:hypothetical protein